MILTSVDFHQIIFINYTYLSINHNMQLFKHISIRLIHTETEIASTV